MNYTINEERLTADEYINFLKKTDLGSQYPKERFEERIATLVTKASISLVARNDAGEIVGVCFGITDFPTGSLSLTLVLSGNAPDRASEKLWYVSSTN